MAIAFVISAVEIGGTTELISVTIDKFKVFKCNLNTSTEERRLDYLLYGLGLLALFSLLISIYLMRRFDQYFSRNIYRNDSQSEHAETVFESWDSEVSKLIRILFYQLK